MYTFCFDGRLCSQEGEAAGQGFNLISLVLSLLEFIENDEFVLVIHMSCQFGQYNSLVYFQSFFIIFFYIIVYF